MKLSTIVITIIFFTTYNFPPLNTKALQYHDSRQFVAVYYYNFALKDYGDATMSKLLDMVKVVAFAVQEGRVAIHCHAGKSILFDRCTDPIFIFAQNTYPVALTFDRSSISYR